LKWMKFHRCLSKLASRTLGPTNWPLSVWYPHADDAERSTYLQDECVHDCSWHLCQSMWLIEPAAHVCSILEWSSRLRQPIMQQFGGGNTMECQDNVGEALGHEFLKILIELREYCGDIAARI
jgi:hypothetical protein